MPRRSHAKIELTAERVDRPTTPHIIKLIKMTRRF
jgi:hypothetical protein